VNSRQRKTLEAVFRDPVSGTMEWASIESLLLAAGCKLAQAGGSHVRFVIGFYVADFHRPHPGKEAKRYQVRDARVFLAKIGVVP
jgi:HicA toxin of bacterial toxin-antitoxin,